MSSQIPRAAVARLAVTAVEAATTPTSAFVVDSPVIEELIVLVQSENCSRCGKRRHLSQVRRSDPGANANARAVEVEPDEPEEECQEIQHVWAMSVCNNSDTPSVEC